MVRYRLRESTASVWSDAELNSEINLAQRYVASQVNAKYLTELFSTDASKLTSEGDTDYDIPTDFLKFAGDVYVNTTRWVVVEDVKQALRMRYSDSNDIDNLNYIAYMAYNQLILHPAPSTTGDVIRVFYIKIPSDLVNDTDIAKLNDTLLNIVIDLAAGNALKKAELERSIALIKLAYENIKEFKQ